MQREDRVVNLEDLKSIVGRVLPFSQETFREMWEFSEKVNATKNKIYRGQPDSPYRIRQHAGSKVAERAVSILLDLYGCSEEDMEVKAFPNWDADLMCPPYALHIKTYTPNPWYERSWTFQHDIKTKRIDKLFKTGDMYDIIVGCEVRYVGQDYGVVGVYLVEPWPEVLPRLSFIDGVDKPEMKGQKLFLRG